MPGPGIEPGWGCPRGILSPLRLPVPPPRHGEDSTVGAGTCQGARPLRFHGLGSVSRVTPYRGSPSRGEARPQDLRVDDGSPKAGEAAVHEGFQAPRTCFDADRCGEVRPFERRLERHAGDALEGCLARVDGDRLDDERVVEDVLGLGMLEELGILGGFNGSGGEDLPLLLFTEPGERFLVHRFDGHPRCVCPGLGRLMQLLDQLGEPRALSGGLLTLLRGPRESLHDPADDVEDRDEDDKTYQSVVHLLAPAALAAVLGLGDRLSHIGVGLDVPQVVVIHDTEVPLAERL